MHKAALFACALLAACSTAPAARPANGETPGRTCRSAGLDRFVGRPATDETGAAILRQSRAAVLRWVPHGTMITMEYRADRVIVWLTADNKKVERVTCG